MKHIIDEVEFSGGEERNVTLKVWLGSLTVVGILVLTVLTNTK